MERRANELAELKLVWCLPHSCLDIIHVQSIGSQVVMMWGGQLTHTHV